MNSETIVETNEGLRLNAIRTGGRTEPIEQKARPALGEELPVFCEHCGYPLHGAPQHRCDQCELLHFHCPECGKRQPINTLRPAALRTLGRLRAWVLGLWVVLKLNLLFWPLAGWWVLSDELGYHLQYLDHWVSDEIVIVTLTFGASFGLVGRLLLLRWRRGWLVSLILGALAAGAIAGGAWSYTVFRNSNDFIEHVIMRIPFMLGALIVIFVAGIIAWPVWVALVRLFLPKHTADVLLDCQRNLSDASQLAK